MTRLLSKALMLALLIQAGIIVSAPAQGGRPIQFSEPRSDKVNTNLARLNQGLSRLDRLESELSRPFDFITPGNSMQGGFITAPLPTPPPAVNNPRVKELIDRKRDLPFMTQEEVFRVESPEDKFKAPELTQDGRDRNTLRRILISASAGSSAPSLTRCINGAPRAGKWCRVSRASRISIVSSAMSLRSIWADAASVLCRPN